MRSVNRMIKTVISIVILALTFAGVPAQAFVQSNDHDCCESELNQMAMPMSAMPMTAMDAAQVTSTGSYVYSKAKKLEMPLVIQHENSISMNSVQIDTSCDDCDSPLSCFSVDGVSYALFFPSKIDIGSPRSDSGLSIEPQFFTLQVSPEIRPPKV